MKKPNVLINSNNGVIAICLKSHFEQRTKLINYYQEFDIPEPDKKDLVSAAQEIAFDTLLKPVFTFVDWERFNKEPFFTGTTEDFQRLKVYLEKSGGNIEGGNFYVPFSNGIEDGIHDSTAEKPAMRNELSFITTPLEFELVFGISLEDLRELPTSNKKVEVEAINFSALSKSL